MMRIDYGNSKKLLKTVCLSIFLIFIILFALFRSKDLIFGVQIKDVNIEDGAKMSYNVIEIKGNALNAVHLTLNDRLISMDQRGNFEETIALYSGYNIMSIEAEDKFGNRDQKNYKLMLLK